MDDMSFAWLLRVDGRGFSFDAALITRAHGCDIKQIAQSLWSQCMRRHRNPRFVHTIADDEGLREERTQVA